MTSDFKVFDLINRKRGITNYEMGMTEVGRDFWREPHEFGLVYVKIEMCVRHPELFSI